MQNDIRILHLSKTGTLSSRMLWSEFAAANAHIIPATDLAAIHARLLTHFRADWQEFAICNIS